MRSDLRSKAGNNKIGDMESKMEEFATKLDLHKLLNKLDAYTTLDSFNKRMIYLQK